MTSLKTKADKHKETKMQKIANRCTNFSLSLLPKTPIIKAPRSGKNGTSDKINFIFNPLSDQVYQLELS